MCKTEGKLIYAIVAKIVFLPPSIYPLKVFLYNNELVVYIFIAKIIIDRLEVKYLEEQYKSVKTNIKGGIIFCNIIDILHTLIFCVMIYTKLTITEKKLY